MISMAYDLAKISMTALLEPAFRAGVELALWLLAPDFN